VHAQDCDADHDACESEQCEDGAVADDTGERPSGRPGSRPPSTDSSARARSPWPTPTSAAAWADSGFEIVETTAYSRAQMTRKTITGNAELATTGISSTTASASVAAPEATSSGEPVAEPRDLAARDRGRDAEERPAREKGRVRAGERLTQRRDREQGARRDRHRAGPNGRSAGVPAGRERASRRRGQPRSGPPRRPRGRSSPCTSGTSGMTALPSGATRKWNA
jgi:hypothetical protein